MATGHCTGIQLMDLQRNTHHVYRLMYHFVWIPKYRYKIFKEPYRSELKAIISKICYDYDIDLVELEVPADHIHMVIRSELKVSPSSVMQIVKSISAWQLFKLRPEIKKKYFWGGKLWTQSYFVESIGNANEEVIRAYAQDQLKVMNEHEDEAQQRGLF